MDHESVYTTHVYDANFVESDETPIQIQQQLEHFILNFRLDNRFIYRYGFWRMEDRVARQLTPSQRSAAGECASPAILLRCRHQRPDQLQRGAGPQACQGAR